LILILIIYIVERRKTGPYSTHMISYKGNAN